MKKPGKPKPKRRRHPQQAAKRTAAPLAVARAVVPAVVTSSARANHPTRQTAHVVSLARPNRDERMALTLLLLPVLVVAAWLTFNQSRLAGRTAPADVASYVPAAVQSPDVRPLAAAPINTPPVTPPSIETRVPDQPVSSPVVVAPPLGNEPTSIATAAPVAARPAIPAESVLPPLPAMPNPEPEIALPRTAALDITATAPLEASSPQPPAAAPSVPSASPAANEQACQASTAQLASFSAIGRFARAPRHARLEGVDAETFGRRLADAAVAQTRDLVIYSARYQPMAYPMGDVVGLQGACIDVVIRAYRRLGIDLQEEVQRGRPSRGDTNIDHRRTENMRRFLDRNGASLPVTAFPEDYKPGDIVTYHRPFSRVSTSHIAVVTGVLAKSGRPMIVHNRGYGAQLEDALFVDRITGHYRYMGGPVQPVAARAGATSAAGPALPVVRVSLPAGTAVQRRHERSGPARDASREAAPTTN